MIKFNMKPLVIALGLGVISLSASAHLASTRTVLNSTDSAVVTVNFAQPVSGDLYLATNVNGALVFFADQGKALTNKVLPFKSNGVFEGSLKVLDVSALGIPPNQYPLYEVVTAPGADPLNFNNWIGGLGGLHKLNFTIGLPVAVSNDRNGDGFSDDDNDHDGYRDGVIDTCKAVARDGKDDQSQDPCHGGCISHPGGTNRHLPQVVDIDVGRVHWTTGGHDIDQAEGLEAPDDTHD